MPGTCGAIWQVTKSPRRQESQWPQWPPCQPTPTRWPVVHPATPGADRVDDAGDLVSRHARVLDAGPESLLGQGVAVADAARLDLDARRRRGRAAGISRSTSSRRPFARATCTTRIFDMACSSGSWLTVGPRSGWPSHLLIDRRHGSAIHAEVHAVDVAGQRAGHECDRGRDVFRTSEPGAGVGHHVLQGVLLECRQIVGR